MTTDAFLSLFAGREAHEPRDPMKAAQASMRPALPRRFYTRASAEPGADGHTLCLDGRTARTPGRRPVTVASAALASALAEEWNGIVSDIDPARMPLTRLINAALDGVATAMEPVREEILAFAGSDLICYRAEAPERLATRQDEAWSPYVAFARDHLGARLSLAAGVIHVAQPQPAIAAVRVALDQMQDPVALAALSSVTSLTGSAIMALALKAGFRPPEQVWRDAHVDDDYQFEVWGRDEEAEHRLALRRRDFDAAALILSHA
jgi:chaperone required for assembly of F1-ATPase